MVTRASTSSQARAPVSLRTLRWATVTRAKTIRAIALPIDAMAVRSNANDRPMAAPQVIRSPATARPATRYPSRGGNWPAAAIASDSPAAGKSPALVAPTVAKRA